MKITIIGAGVAGSVLTDILSEMGHEVTLIEKSKSPGGTSTVIPLKLSASLLFIFSSLFFLRTISFIFSTEKGHCYWPFCGLLSMSSTTSTTSGIKDCDWVNAENTEKIE